MASKCGRKMYSPCVVLRPRTRPGEIVPGGAWSSNVKLVVVLSGQVQAWVGCPDGAEVVAPPAPAIARGSLVFFLFFPGFFLFFFWAFDEDLSLETPVGHVAALSLEVHPNRPGEAQAQGLLVISLEFGEN